MYTGRNSDSCLHVHRRSRETSPGRERNGQLFFFPVGLRNYYGRPQLFRHDQNFGDHRGGSPGKPNQGDHQGCRREKGTAMMQGVRNRSDRRSVGRNDDDCNSVTSVLYVCDVFFCAGFSLRELGKPCCTR